MLLLALLITRWRVEPLCYNCCEEWKKRKKKLWYSLDKRRATVVSEKLVSDY